MSQANYYPHSGVTSEGLCVCLQPWLFPRCLFIPVVTPGLYFHFWWPPLSSHFSLCYWSGRWGLLTWWGSDIVVAPVSVSPTGAVWGCRSCWVHTLHFFWVEIRTCTSIKTTSWCRAWLTACDEDLLRPYIPKVGSRCLAGMGMLASSLHWASSHLASREEEVTAWRGQHGLEGWKNVSGSWHLQEILGLRHLSPFWQNPTQWKEGYLGWISFSKKVNQECLLNFLLSSGRAEWWEGFIFVENGIHPICSTVTILPRQWSNSKDFLLF